MCNPKLPELPVGFVEHMRRTGKKTMTLREIADEWERYTSDKEHLKSR